VSSTPVSFCNAKTFPRLKEFRITIPSLFIAGTKDAVLKPEMAARMESKFDNLTKEEVVAGHWALSEAASDVNAILKEWFETQVFGSKSSL
jgi:soluble epoxide hydrolase / lipid-phosphate phosphatase